MLNRLFPNVRCSPPTRAAQTARPRIVRRAALALVALALTSLAQAGPDEVPRQSRATFRAVTLDQFVPAATPKSTISKAPHLVAVGPMEIAILPLAGPRFRQPPLLPAARATKVEPVAEPTPAPASLQEEGRKNIPEPSAFSPDAAPTLLPGAQTPELPAVPTLTPAIKNDASAPALVPMIRREPELKDAVIYFETPVGPTGSQVTIPALAPLQSPATNSQPESRASYRKEKE